MSSTVSLSKYPTSLPKRNTARLLSRPHNARPRARFILTSLAAALVPALAFGADQIKTWDAIDNNGAATANNNFYNLLNWNGDTRPTFTGNTDSILFDGAGSGSTIGLNITGGLTEYLVKSITFNSGTYTINGGQNLTFGDATSSLNNTGNLTNNSPNTQTFNPSGLISFSFGTINAASGGFTFGAASRINIGNESAAAGRNVTVDGAFNVTVNGVLSGVGTDSSEGGHLIKNGTNTLFLQGDSPSWGGRITVTNGTLQINKGNALGSNDGRTTITGGDSTGRLQFAGGINVSENLYIEGRTAGSLAPHLNNTSGNNSISAPIRLQAGGPEFGIQTSGGTLTLNGNIIYDTVSGPTNLTLGGNATGTVNGKIGAGGLPISLIKSGGGTWTLTAANDYTGSTQINEGRLNLTTSQIGGGAIALADGATLGVSLIAAGQTLNTSSLTLGTAAGGTLALDLGAFGNPTAALINATNLTINGGSTLQLSAGGVGLSIGQFPLIQYSNTLGGSGFAGLTLGSLPPRVTANLLDDSAGRRILLNVTAFDIPRWTGKLSSDWDATDGTVVGTENWEELNSKKATTYLQGEAGTDSALFDDTATTTTPGAANVNLTTILTPTTVTVDNSTLTYTFGGIGKLSGGANLVKKGSGTLILANTGGNDYTGTTKIEAGTLQIGDGITDGGGGVGTGEITNNGTLIINRPDAVTVGPVIGGNGAIIKQGAGAATLSSNNTYTGAVTVSSGTLKLGNSNALGSTVAGTTVESGATLDVNGRSVPVGEIVSVSGSGVLDAGALINTGTGGAAVGLKNVVLTGATTFGGSTRWDIRDNEGGLNANGFELSKVGTNNIFLADLGETHLGNVVISSGRIAFEGNTTLGDQTGKITVAAGAELGFEDSTVAHTKAIQLDGGTINATAGVDNRIDSPITLNASGTVRTAANTTLTIGGVVSGTASFTKNGAGVLIITGNNTYEGVTVVTQGTLRIGGDGPSGSLGTGDISLEATSGNTATLGFRRSDTGLIVSNNIISSGTGSNVVNIGATNGTVPATAIITFTGNNTFTGPVNINGGSLRITNSSALGTIVPETGPKTISIASNNKPSLRLDGSAGNINLSADLNFITSNDDVNFPAILNEAGDNSIAGSIALNTANGGNTRVTVNAGTSLTLGGAISPATTSTTARTLILDGAGTGTVNGIASNSNRVLSLTKAGTGTWTLNAANTYTGTTSVQGGTLKLGSTGSISSSARLDIASGATLDVSAATGFTLSSNQTLAGSGTIVGNVTDAIGAVITPGGTGIGTLAFVNNLTLNGGARIQYNLPGSVSPEVGITDQITVGGNLALNAPTTLEIVPTGALLLGGSLTLITYAGTLTGTAENLTLSHNTRYTLSLDTATAGQIKLAVSGAAQNLTWSGDNGANVWNVNSAANWNGGTEKFYDIDSVTFDDSTDNTSITIEGTVIPNGVTVNGSKNYTFLGTGGAINGAPAGLTKNGTGTLTLLTSNSYTGPTQVNGGTLIVSGSINGSAVTVANGATIGGSGTITTNNQPFVLESGAHLSPGVNIGTLTINTGTSSLDLSAAFATLVGGALAFDLDALGASDKITLSGGTLNIGTGVLGFDDFAFTALGGFTTGTYTLIETSTNILGSFDGNPANLTGFINGQSATLSIGDNGTDLVLTVVPEPSTAALLIGGFGTLLGIRRRRRPNR